MFEKLERNGNKKREASLLASLVVNALNKMIKALRYQYKVVSLQCFKINMIYDKDQENKSPRYGNFCIHG